MMTTECTRDSFIKIAGRSRCMVVKVEDDAARVKQQHSNPCGDHDVMMSHRLIADCHRPTPKPDNQNQLKKSNSGSLRN
jgi:hypothetical protein